MTADLQLYRFKAHPADDTPGGDIATLAFVFHGTGGDESQFYDLGRQLLPDAGLIAPRGDVSEHGALRFFRRTAEGVYDMEDLARRTETMARFVAAHAAARGAGTLVGLGYSNGANILASVMMHRPELFDRAVMMHPLIPWTPRPQSGLAGRHVLITAGRRDPIGPPAQTEALARWFAENKANVALEWHDGGHELRPNEIEAARRFFADLLHAAA